MKLRFSIRQLLWLTLVVALCVGWWIDHRRVFAIAEHFRLQAMDLRERFEPHGNRGTLIQAIMHKDEMLEELHGKLSRLQQELEAERAKGSTSP